MYKIDFIIFDSEEERDAKSKGDLVRDVTELEDREPYITVYTDLPLGEVEDVFKKRLKTLESGKFPRLYRAEWLPGMCI